MLLLFDLGFLVGRVLSGIYTCGPCVRCEMDGTAGVGVCVGVRVGVERGKGRGGRYARIRRRDGIKERRWMGEVR